MKKTVVITVMIDDVSLEDVSDIAEAINEVFKEYEHKRVDINLSDTPMVRPVLEAR